MKPNITSKQIKILSLLFKYRFLNTNQIYQLLSHKNPRQTQEWLKDLTEKGYIYQKYSRERVERANKPAIYNLLSKSIPVLKMQGFTDSALLERIYKETTRSDRFKEHSQFIADIYLKSRQIYSGQEATFHFSTATDLVGYEYLPKELPDAYIAIKEKNLTKRYLLELIDDGVPRFAIKVKITKYLDYFTNNTWEEHTKDPFPKVLFVCPNVHTKTYMVRTIKSMSEGRDISFYLTTKDNIKNEGITSEIWEKVS